MVFLVKSNSYNRRIMHSDPSMVGTPVIHCVCIWGYKNHYIGGRNRLTSGTNKQNQNKFSLCLRFMELCSLEQNQ